MLKFELSLDGKTATVALDSLDPNTPAPIQYSGDSELIEAVKDWFNRQYGAFGHMMFSEFARSIDFHCVFASGNGDPWFTAKLIEGTAPSYDPEIPEGAMT